MMIDRPDQELDVRQILFNRTRCGHDQQGR
jgi:hypothetical protein